jgi:hypothetical protein
MAKTHQRRQAEIRSSLHLSNITTKRLNEVRKRVFSGDWGGIHMRQAIGSFGEPRKLEEVELSHRLKKMRYRTFWEGGGNSVTGPGFLPTLRHLRRKFPGETLQVLDEGSGGSSFGRELQEQAVKAFGKESIRIFESDAYPRTKYGSGVHDLRTLVAATPEELVKEFGPEKFHLIVSTHGGINYTPLPKIKGLVNIAIVLKSGGEARIKISGTQLHAPKVLKAVERLHELMPELVIRVFHTHINSVSPYAGGGSEYRILIRKKRL